MIGQVKRSLYVFFWIEDGPLFDVAEFLRGGLEVSRQPQLLALSLLSESRYPITREDLRLLAELPADSWSEAAELGLDAARLESLATRGLLLSDSDDPDLARFRHRDKSLTAQQWHPYAAFYHFMTRERERNVGIPGARVPDTEHLAASAAEDAAKFVERYGPPPEHFHRAAQACRVVDLPLVERAGGFYDLLGRRKTSRAFEISEPLGLDDFATLLRYTFGCHGHAELSPGFVTLHKTSPSGGSLHPIEAYPLVLNVENLETGFYHYEAQSHSVELVRPLELAAARDLAGELSGGQSHARSAHSLIVMTARFLRCYWKYRQRSQAYGSLLLEAGHFSQTLYLVAAELGLGVFFSSVIDGTRADEVLGLRPEEEGAIALAGCGVKPKEGPDLGLDFQAYAPRKTVI